MKDSRTLFKRLGFMGIGLCAACCLLPGYWTSVWRGSIDFYFGLFKMGRNYFHGCYPRISCHILCAQQKSTGMRYRLCLQR